MKIRLSFLKNARYIFVLALLLFNVMAPGLAAEKGSAAPAPDFQLQDLEGATVTLSDYRDKQPVMLFFWTIECSICRDELRVLSARCAKLVEDGFQLLAINVGDPPNRAASYIKKFNLCGKVLLDKEFSVFEKYRLLGVPTYVLIDKQGSIRYIGHTYPVHGHKD